MFLFSNSICNAYKYHSELESEISFGNTELDFCLFLQSLWPLGAGNISLLFLKIPVQVLDKKNHLSLPSMPKSHHKIWKGTIQTSCNQ